MKKNKEIKVSKIIINVGDKEIRVTPDEAKELYNVLSDLLGKKEVNPYFYPLIPYYPKIYKDYWIWDNEQPIVTYTDKTCTNASYGITSQDVIK